jgi:hypothetical protein
MKGIRVRVWKHVTTKGLENENKGYIRFVAIGTKTQIKSYL